MADEQDRSGEEQPPKLEIKNGNGASKPAPKGKSETSRIELSEAEAPPVEAKPGEPVSVREVLKGETGKLSTARITLGGAPAQGPAPGGKSDTSRIALEAAEKPTPEEAAEIAKDSTVRMDLTGAGATAASAVQEAQKNRTARIRIEEEPEGVEPRSATARIDLEGAPAEPPAAQAPRTVRLQRPTAMPKTVVLKKPGQESEEQLAKGATSKISVPEAALAAQPVTQRKTIRIKRSDAPSSSAKTLTIARPVKAEGATTPAAGEEQLKEILEEVRQDEPGPAFSVLALVAVLVVAVLVYVLAAQTVAPTLPFPGRIL